MFCCTNRIYANGKLSNKLIECSLLCRCTQVLWKGKISTYIGHFMPNRQLKIATPEAFIPFTWFWFWFWLFSCAFSCSSYCLFMFLALIYYYCFCSDSCSSSSYCSGFVPVTYTDALSDSVSGFSCMKNFKVFLLFIVLWNFSLETRMDFPTKLIFNSFFNELNKCFAMIILKITPVQNTKLWSDYKIMLSLGLYRRFCTFFSISLKSLMSINTNSQHKVIRKERWSRYKLTRLRDHIWPIPKPHLN